MFHILLIILLSIDFFVTNDPILIASPYPFNTSKSSHIECFTNDQGIILSLRIIATMLDINQKNIPSLEYTKYNLTKNESIILTIPSLFNYSQLYSKIECHSKYYHGEQKMSQLQVLSVVEIPQKEFLSINTYTKQMININCITYGTNVFIQWDFSKDMSKDIFGPLPIGIRIYHKFILNDTLIIDHVSYLNHQGYYRCYARNTLLGITYEDRSIIYLNVQKNRIWIPIVIVCVIIGICILILILCSKYCQKKRKKKIEVKENSQEDEKMIDKIKEIVLNQESIESSPFYDKQKSSERILKNVEELRLQEENGYTHSHSENSIKSQISDINPISISKTSPQFVLGNPFLDPNVQSLLSARQYMDKLK